MSYSAKNQLNHLHGITDEDRDKLIEAGILDAGTLLERCRTVKGRIDVERQTKVPHSNLLHYVHQADLMRIKGVGPVTSHLLEEVGVRSLKQLAHRSPQHLHDQIARYLETHPHAKDAEGNQGRERMPSLHTCQHWVESARELLPSRVEDKALDEAVDKAGAGAAPTTEKQQLQQQEQQQEPQAHAQ
eukprot:GEZU01036868.1.p1 GENE.GEZU01036868.1~~GEZU01036868.1.p1  ORF type:complete len:187 (-),score=41.99 GEZU01036868.1:25-585(-)